MRVVVGVSGGADSVGLLLLLRQLAPEYDLQLHVVHLNHMLRPESAADAAFVQRLARRWGLPVTIGHARVGAIARRLRIGIEEAGRLARYRLLEQVAGRIGAQRIAVGHHADDQVETVLLNIIRGAGPGGLGGIPPRRGRVVRPLLCASREEIASYCRAAALDWRTDTSNLSPEFVRNRIRHRLLPLLRKEFNPHADQAILRLVEIVAEENRFLGRCVQSLLRRMLVEGGDERSRQPGQAAGAGPAPAPGEVRLALPAFSRLPLALRRRLLRAAVREAGGSLRHLGYQNVEDCLDFLSRGGPGGAVQLPHGVRVSKGPACFTVAVSGALSHGQGGQAGTAERQIAPVPLSVPGETPLPGLGLTIRARLVNIVPGETTRPRRPGSRDRVYFDYDRLAPPLVVRTRRAGDRIQPFGMQGAKKLKKLLNELRVTGGSRDRIALVLSNDRIIWVVGYRRAQAAPVTGQTRRVLVLEADRL